MKYYSTQRPAAPGTFPKPDGNKVLEIVNFDKRQYCREAGRDCWGYIAYEHPLAEKQAVDYEPVREQLLDFKQRYMACAGTPFLRTFATVTVPIIGRSRKRSVLTKQGLRVHLQQGHTLNDLLAFGPGQDCEIFKADKFYPGDVVIYVPDVCLNHIPLDRPITDPEEFSEVLSNCYTGQDFIDECSGDEEKAKRLLCYCDWQHPSSAIDELADEEEES